MWSSSTTLICCADTPVVPPPAIVVVPDQAGPSARFEMWLMGSSIEPPKGKAAAADSSVETLSA